MIPQNDIMIQCESEVYNLFKELWNEFGCKPDKFYYFYNGSVQTYCMRWLGSSWDTKSNAISAFNALMFELSRDEYKNRQGYGYKCLQIHEDYSLGKFSNFRGDFIFIDFQINIDFNFPEVYNSKEQELL